MNKRDYYLHRAEGEQQKSFSPEAGIEKRRRGSVATRQQMFGYRRSAETILIEMVDMIRRSEARETATKAAKIIDNIEVKNMQSSTIKEGRTRRRGPRGQRKRIGKDDRNAR